MEAEFPASWLNCSLGEFLELKRGYDLPKRIRKSGNVPIVSSSGPSGWHNEAKVDGPGVVTGRYGTVGKVFYIEDDFWPLNTALYIRDFKGSDPKFVSYFLKTIQWSKYVDKSAVPGVNRNHVHLESVIVPPLPEQRRIAGVLGALDDKIELNRKMNRTLEEMAQALFKSWFIDFDGHDDLVDSELGPIPKGWEVLPADKVADVGIGKTPPRKESQWFSTSSEDVPWISIKDLGQCGTYVIETSECLTQDAVEKFRVRQIPESTVVLSFKLTVGRVAITNQEMLSNEAIAHFKLGEDAALAPEYLYCYLGAFQYGSLGSTSSIATAINSKIVKSMPILIPPRARLEAWQDSVTPIFKKLKLAAHENISLTQLRDTLLPKLISGEIRVPEAEEAVVAAL